MGEVQSLASTWIATGFRFWRWGSLETRASKASSSRSPSFCQREDCIFETSRRSRADTNQAIFYVENEQVAVADNYIAPTSIYPQQISGGSLMFNKAPSRRFATAII